MKDAKQREAILRMVAKRRGEDTSAYHRAAANLAGEEASRKFWDEQNPMDGVGCMSTNPYKSSKRMQESVDRALKNYNDSNELFDWVCSNIFTIEDLRKEQQTEGSK